MDLSRPYSALSPSLDLDVLVELAGSKQARSGRELARRTGRSWGGVGPVLERLVEHGLVDRDEVGVSYVFTLNRRHLLAPLVEDLAGLRTKFFVGLRELLASWELQPLHASIFGSMARGDGDATSDIDIFVVRPQQVDLEDETWREQLFELSDHVRALTGNDASLIEVGSEELDEMRLERRSLLVEIGSEAVDLAGETARRLAGK